MVQEITFEARAVLKNYRSTAQKSRRVINLVRDKNVEEARTILRFSPQAVSEPVLKLLNSAVANALTKADRLGLRVTEDKLFISEVFADEGPTMKRFRPRARGSAGRIFKRTSHITLAVATDEEVLVTTTRNKSSDKSASKVTDTAISADDATIATDETNDKSTSKAASKKSTTKSDDKSTKGKLEEKDPSKAPGKQHKSVGPKDIKAHGDNKAGKSASGHRKENMRKKGA